MIAKNPRDFDFLEIGLASPDKIRFWSYGEVEKPETINYRTFKPERKGLFCERIFGPVKDWECSCGKYRRVRYRGIVCERCGVEVTHSKVRRERMGHIELAADVCHIWFLKGIPSYIGLLLDMSARQLEEVVYYDSFLVVSVDDSIAAEVQPFSLLSIGQYFELKEKHGNLFTAEMGASAIKKLLSSLNLEEIAKDLREQLVTVKGQKRLKVTKRLRVVESLAKSGNRPEWMVLEVIPVMPPDLRPMVQLEGGRFATSDLNDLYRRVVNRNNRLKRLLDIGAPEMIVRNEKRMLQESVDVLISNGKRGRAVTGSNGRPLKSLGNIIEGKQGRFRQNLLGKRVDYSARSVIVVGPTLKFHQCGLPKEMALELFKPFVIRKLVQNGIVSNVKTAKRMIDAKEVVVWDMLETIIEGHPVLLNRAPTLHRLGIQAFEPILVEGKAIQVHPLVCTAFNADFDGDQMAVHVPLCLEAQTECRTLILSTNNILAPSSGRAVVTPTQEMVLGCYYLTIDDPSLGTEPVRFFSDVNEVMRGLFAKSIKLQSPIRVNLENERVDTTAGRIIFNEAIRSVLRESSVELMDFANYPVGKKQLSQIVFDLFRRFGNDITVLILDKLKYLGFRYATVSGISISIDDLKIPKDKDSILKSGRERVLELEDLQKAGVITNRERILRSNDIWREITHSVSSSLEFELGALNNLYMMANSGARGNMDQVRQLAGMRGLMSDAQGRTIEIPIRSNFKEGLSMTEYFISSYGARKGLVDTALRTADSGYLTRRLVDVAQDVMVVEEDCGTTEGVFMTSIKDGINVLVPLNEIIEGRIAVDEVCDPATNEVLVDAGAMITTELSIKIVEAGIDTVLVRSPYKCKSHRGVCQKCYGLDVALSSIVNIGEAIGIIAAQSIGEPGTQLTMRTFHTGGVDLRRASKVDIKVKQAGTVRFSSDLVCSKVNLIDGNSFWINIREGAIDVTFGKDKRSYLVPQGSVLNVKDGQKVKADDIVAEYDPDLEFIFSQSSGMIKYVGVELIDRFDENNKLSDRVSKKDAEICVYNHNSIEVITLAESQIHNYNVYRRLRPGMEIGDKKIDFWGVIIAIEKSKTDNAMYDVSIAPGESYPILAGASIYLEEGVIVAEGEVVASERIGSADASKTKDIVQGLPRVEELFEARKPKDAAILSEISGVAEISDSEAYKILSISNEKEKKEYKVPYGVRLKVYSGKVVQKGDMLVDGTINPHDLVVTKGVHEAQNYLAEEIQKVYRSQGVQIHTKHIEVIVRQMLRKVNIVEMGDSDFLPNEFIDVRLFTAANQQLFTDGKDIAVGERVLMGITRAALNTESFISASSFQQTAAVLTKAAIEGQSDPMYGLKENVIIGKLIPAGTGMPHYEHVSIDYEDEEESVSTKGEV